MSTAKAPDHQSPVPDTVYAERLEHIRAFNGVPNLKAFWKRIENFFARDVSETTCSYASARYYHSDRDPPVDYLRQVSVVYNVPIEYLVFGRGSPSLFAPTDTLGEGSEGVETVGGIPIPQDYSDEMKRAFRVIGAIRAATAARHLPLACECVIRDYLVDLVQREGLQCIGWQGDAPQPDDTDELQQLADAAIDRHFGFAIRHRADIPPTEVIASVMAAAIPLYLRPTGTIECPRCGRERPDRVRNCQHCGAPYPDKLMQTDTTKED